jgi:hypothetical protein
VSTVHLSGWKAISQDPYTHDNINKLEMVQRRAARYVQDNYHNTSSVTSMIDTPFEVILSMWVFHLRFDCSVTPRYFAEVTGSRM